MHAGHESDDEGEQPHAARWVHVSWKKKAANDRRNGEQEREEGVQPS